jgi:hypothetical protein
MNWINKVKIKNLMTEEEDYENIQNSMNAIADVLDKERCFMFFETKALFRHIPKGDETFSPIDYANKYLERMYDYADAHKIWIE